MRIRRMNNSWSEIVLHQVKLPELRRVAFRRSFGGGIRMKRWIKVIIFTGALLMSTLAPFGTKAQPGSTTKKSFGNTPDAHPVDLYALTKNSRAEVPIT